MSEVHLPHVEVPEPEHVTDRLSRLIAIAIVVATLATAVVGFLHSRADRTVEQSAVTGQRLGIEGMGALLRSQQMAQSVFDTYSLQQEQRASAANAFQRYLFTPRGQDLQFKLEQELEQRIAEGTGNIASTTATDSGLPDPTAGGPASAEQDPAFPSRFFATSARQAVRFRALQDAENEYRSAWEGRSATYTAILTLFAVALFLFGLSLTLGPGVRRLFAAVGVGLMLVGGVWTIVRATAPPHHAPDEAATAYAQGWQALQTAHDPAGYRDAVRALSRAIELRPTFGLAYQDRAEAEFRAGSPQTAGIASISEPSALEAATADLERARDLGLDNSLVIGNLGFFDFELGMQRRDQGLLEDAVEFSEEAAAERPRDPALRFNVAVALLGAGRAEEAEAAYRQAVLETIYTDPAKKETRGDPFAEEAYAAGALTDLETVARYREDLASEVTRLKEFVVGSVGAESVQPLAKEGRSAAEQVKVEADAFPAEVQWSATIPGYSDDHVLSAQWYYLDRAKLGWSVLPTVSGVAAPQETAEGERFQLQSYLASSTPPRCLPDGQYRVELYLDGTLVGTGETSAAFGDLTAVAARDLNVAFCRPPDWKQDGRSQTGLVTGYQSDDGSRGAYVFRFSRPEGFLDVSDTKQSSLFLESTLDNFSDILPAGRPTYSVSDGTDHGYFMGLDGPTKRYYDYTGGTVRGAAGVTDDGAIIVALVFGPVDDFHTGGLGLHIVDSLSILEKASAG